jgi:polar amino acid transport system substrate-binding protein
VKKICAILGILVVLMCVTAAYAGPALDKILKKGELVVGTSGDYPPFSARTKDGRLIGFDVDMANIVAGCMGVKATLVRMPFSDLLVSLDSGKIDMIISAMTITPARNLKFVFVGPYFVSGQSILTTKWAAIKASTLADVNKPDFTLAVPVGTTSELAAVKNLPKVTLIRAKTMDEALAMLLSGKAKAVLTDSATAAVTTFRYQDKGIVTTGALTYEPIGIAIPPNDPLLQNFLENMLTNLKGGGDLDAMIDKWFKDPSWVKDLQ